MLKKKYLVLVGLALILLAGCSGGVATPQPLEEPTGALASAPAEALATSEPVLVEEIKAEEPANYCLECHSSQQRLQETVDPNLNQELLGLNWAGVLPERELWERVFVDSEKFIPTVHGQFPCTSCHGGNQSPEKETAHTGLIKNPSQGPEVVCGQCHPDVDEVFHTSLHATVQGFWKNVEARSTTASHPALENALADNCVSCHNTCGDCHVSQPRSVGGGLLDGHLFDRNPPTELSCNSCHGSRSGEEFMGDLEGLPADVHYSQGQMDCVDCHTGRELHGEPADCISCHPGPEGATVPPPEHRYDDVQNPRCESCHAAVATGQDDVIMHQMHGANLSCQVCHSVAYTNCEGCHVGENGSAYTLDASYSAFLIGRNPIQTFERPYRFVPVRHAPVAPDSFEAYGSDLLPNFDKRETWHYTTPHNIQRNTPQTASCNACHGNPDLFLTADKVAPEELKANRNVIIEEIPPQITSAEQVPDYTR
jgi:hypothetical protein